MIANGIESGKGKNKEKILQDLFQTEPLIFKQIEIQYKSNIINLEEMEK